MAAPLADRIRPTELSDVVGQQHLLGEGRVLRRIIESGQIPNMIFFGPSGTGKTTVAGIIAARTRMSLHRLNATNASIQDVKDVIGEVGTLAGSRGILLYLDEIQYFNKKQPLSRRPRRTLTFMCTTRFCPAVPCLSSSRSSVIR